MTASWSATATWSETASPATQLDTYTLVLSEIPADERRRAALAVCAAATDADEARVLLDMLGLLP